MNHTSPQTIKDKVLTAIKAGQVTMRPKWHYVLKAALMLTGAAILSLALLYLASFIIFYLRQSGVWFAPSFGFRGVAVFLTSLPWLLILVSIAFLIILEVLVRRYSFAYHQPLLFSALGIVLLTTLGGIAVASTPLHNTFLKQVKEHRFPMAEPLYFEFGVKGASNVHPGSIQILTDDGFVLHNRRDEEFNVIVTPRTRFPIGYDLTEGDFVVVLGERENGTIQAFGVREIEAMPGEFVPMPMHSFPARFRPPLPQ